MANRQFRPGAEETLLDIFLNRCDCFLSFQRTPPSVTASSRSKPSTASPCRPSHGGLRRKRAANWRISLGFGATAALGFSTTGRSLWPLNDAMTGGFTICWAMFGNGAQMGSAATLPGLSLIRLALWRAPRARCAAAPGTTTPGACAPRTAARAIAASGSAALGSAAALEPVVGQAREGSRASAAAREARQLCTLKLWDLTPHLPASASC